MNKRIVFGVGIALTAFTVAITTNYIQSKVESFIDRQELNKVNSNDDDSISVNSDVTNVNDIIKVEDGYMSSIVQGKTDEETISLNRFIWDCDLSVKELIESKNVAENFTQGISLYDSSNPNKHLNRAKKYGAVGLDVWEWIPAFSWLGAKENTKEMKIEGITTECFEHIIDEDILVYKVITDWAWIDFSDIVASRASTEYIISVKNIDGQYKVVDYYDR